MNKTHFANNLKRVQLMRLRMMTSAKLPDALRLSGLRNLCNLLKLHVFVGRIRRLRRIRHEQNALCQQSEARPVDALENDDKRKIA
ncbi:hypothetical protein EYW98_20955 [Escherichia coli]|uniref:hypothetical protein n=1 Tax=Escherichia sp. MOD1-EC7003 TaxID=2093900 RepID=UPI0012FFD66C|nr:hypothetical protein [Escherichia sp. MOD1-EC7003]EGO8361794.1 hypothetical protein [Escherichia coli]EGO8377365.1 hypothetical protein [Escherichia coli]